MTKQNCIAPQTASELRFHSVYFWFDPYSRDSLRTQFLSLRDSLVVFDRLFWQAFTFASLIYKLPVEPLRLPGWISSKQRFEIRTAIRERDLSLTEWLSDRWLEGNATVPFLRYCTPPNRTAVKRADCESRQELYLCLDAENCPVTKMHGNRMLNETLFALDAIGDVVVWLADESLSVRVGYLLGMDPAVWCARLCKVMLDAQSFAYSLEGFFRPNSGQSLDEIRTRIELAWDEQQANLG